MTTIEFRRATSLDELQAAREVVLTIAESELGYGYQQQWHWDLDRLIETYVDNPRQAMFVAVADGKVVATSAVRIGGPLSPPHPSWLAERYGDRERVAQLLRVATLAEHRRKGIAHQLVLMCRDFVRSDGGFRVLYLHTNAKVPGAESFWRSMPVAEVYDARGGDHDSDPRFETIHFELPL